MPAPFPIGSSGNLRFAPQRGRSPDSKARAGLRYPSPFFDIGHTYLPSNLKSLLRWCRYYYHTNPIINTAVTKMASYPLTNLHYDTDSVGLHKAWDDLLMRDLKLRSFQYGVGLDYYCMGNAFVGISFPFRKHLICKHCNVSKYIKEVDYKFRDFKYEGRCSSCRHHGVFTVKDQYIRTTEGIRLMRWNPEDINIDYNAYNGKKRILYTVPVRLKNDIRLGKKSIIEEIPDIYVRAVEKNKAMVLSKVFHFSRESIAQDVQNMGWGIPMIMPVLKDTYYLQMLRKAQEMIAQEHIVPLRIIFPAAGSATSDPYSSVSLQNWSSKIVEQVEMWKYDSNHIPVMPIPIGQQTLGGNGRALLLSQEMRLIEEQIIAGMGVPIEFVKGGTSFGGTSLSMHILKNQFETYRAFMLEMIQHFIIDQIANHMGWPKVTVRLKRFHMADDLQRASLSFQLNQAAKLSDKTLLEELDYDISEETEIIKRESGRQLKNMSTQALEQAHQQGKGMLVQQRYQAAAMAEQQQPPPPPAQVAATPVRTSPAAAQVPPPQPQEPQVDKQKVAKTIANQLAKMPESQMYSNLSKLQPYPELHALVMTELNQMRGRPNSAGKPLPEERAPRRGPSEAIT